MRELIVRASAAALVLGCGPRPAPATVASQTGATCPDSARDSVDLTGDVRRGPRYGVDSAGGVESLPPVPASDSDSVSRGCPEVPDTASAPAREDRR